MVTRRCGASVCNPPVTGATPAGSCATYALCLSPGTFVHVSSGRSAPPLIHASSSPDGKPFRLQQRETPTSPSNPRHTPKFRGDSLHAALRGSPGAGSTTPVPTLHSCAQLLAQARRATGGPHRKRARRTADGQPGVGWGQHQRFRKVVHAAPKDEGARCGRRSQGHHRPFNRRERRVHAARSRVRALCHQQAADRIQLWQAAGRGRATAACSGRPERETCGRHGATAAMACVWRNKDAIVAT